MFYQIFGKYTDSQQDYNEIRKKGKHAYLCPELIITVQLEIYRRGVKGTVRTLQVLMKKPRL